MEKSSHSMVLLPLYSKGATAKMIILIGGQVRYLIHGENQLIIDCTIIH